MSKAKKVSAESVSAVVSDKAIIIEEFKTGVIRVPLLGVTPFICNRQSEKTKRELLFPAEKKTRAHQALTLKHDPLREYQASPYLSDDPDSLTHILMKGGAFKSAACDSAVDSETLKAAQVRRLVSVPDFYVEIFGIPQMWMTDVRQAGISRTPDIRTRAIIPQWAAFVTFQFVLPLIDERKLCHLIANGGMTRGVGDGRTEKGALDFGQFTIVPEDDPRLQDIIATGGKAAQEAAMENPEPYDRETRELYTWFEGEFKQRSERSNISKTKDKNGSGAGFQEVEELLSV